MRRFAIILGGGRSARMGRDKRSLVLDGRSLLALAIEACAARDQVVVVAPDLPVDVAPRRVLRTLEDPPFGGPVAGIAAGMAALPPEQPQDEVLVLACDLPRVGEVVAALDGVLLDAPAVSASSAERVTSASDRVPGSDGVCLLDAENYPQYLAARYRRDALTAQLAAVGDPRAQSVRRLMAGLSLRRVPAPDITGDVDTPAEASAAGIE